MSENLHKDVHELSLDGRQFLIIGTAHISKDSVDLVKQVITDEKPDVVCLELDAKRYEAMTKKNLWESLNLKEIIRKKQLPTLLIQLMLSNYQKRMSQQTGVSPGSEMLEADRVAKEYGIAVELSDREAGITLKRTWRKTSFLKKVTLLGNIFGSLFDRTELDEAQLAKIKEADAMTETLQDLGKSLPSVKQVLIDERDVFLAEKIKSSSGQKVVAVVGAGHIKGILQHMHIDQQDKIEEFESLPPTAPWGKILGWGIPTIIVGLLVATFFTGGLRTAQESLLFWTLVNGSLSALGALLAFAHPLSIVAAFVAAPITSLTPIIGAGYVVAFIQIILVPPLVKDIQSIGDDFNSIHKWWTNKALRVFLVFIFSSLGSAIGTYVGGFEVIKNFFQGG